jgi:hypothetical protein
MREWRCNFTITDLCTGWKPRPLYLLGKNLQQQLDRSLGGLQNRSGSYGEEKNLLLLSVT